VRFRNRHASARSLFDRNEFSRKYLQLSTVTSMDSICSINHSGSLKTTFQKLVSSGSFLDRRSGVGEIRSLLPQRVQQEPWGEGNSTEEPLQRNLPNASLLQDNEAAKELMPPDGRRVSSYWSSFASRHPFPQPARLKFFVSFVIEILSIRNLRDVFVVCPIYPEQQVYSSSKPKESNLSVRQFSVTSRTVLSDAPSCSRA